MIAPPLTAGYGILRLVRDRSESATAVAFMILTILYVTGLAPIGGAAAV